MKKFLLYYSILALSLIMTLCACGTESSPSANPSAGYTIDGNNLAQYQIVRSDYAEGDLVRCAMDVRSTFETAGYDLKLTTDFYREGYEEYAMGEFEILVGATNRPETAEFLDGLQMWQYGYALVGQKIVIAGHDEASTRLAVEEFNSFVTGRSPFTFAEDDRFVHGEVKKGTGRTYSLLTLDASFPDAASLSAQTADASPDFLIVQGADDAVAAQFLPEGYALGSDHTAAEGGVHTLMYYNTSVYTYSSAGAYEMSRLPMLTAAEKGSFSYCVVRCAETKDKYVFCSADLSGVPESGLRDRLETFGSFADNCAALPIFFGGSFDGSADSTACTVLTDYGYADVTRLAKETSGECTELYLYASYNRLVPDKSEVTGGGIYTEFRRAE